MITPAQARVLREAQETTTALERLRDHRWLSLGYPWTLYGGWLRADGSKAPAHTKAMRLHMAERALYCPTCKNHVGFIGSDEDERFHCAECDHWLDIPPEDPEGGFWLVAGPKFTTHFRPVICPYIEQALKPWIIRSERNPNNGCTVQWEIQTDSGRVEILIARSYEQYLKEGKDSTSAFEGITLKGGWKDEPMPQGAWQGVERGLMSWRSRYEGYPFVQQFKYFFVGGGVRSSKSWTGRSSLAAMVLGRAPWDGSLRRNYGAIVATATPLECPWVYHDIYRRAWNKGGDRRHIFAIEFDIRDNPSLTEEVVRDYERSLPMELREARIHGRFKFLTGRVFPEFETNHHVFDWDPLAKRATGEPSDWPVFASCDPHTRRPWYFLWCAVSPKGDLYIFREYPNEPFNQLKQGGKGFDSYADLVNDIEGAFPGGPSRVINRAMDPRFGRTSTAGSEDAITIQEEMEDRGIYFECPAVRGGAEEAGYSAIRTLLSYDRAQPVTEMNRAALFVHRSCRNLIGAFENLTYRDFTDSQKGVNEKVYEEYKDPIDALRYLLDLEPSYVVRGALDLTAAKSVQDATARLRGMNQW